mgnify:CR=1 FL=1
MMEAPLANHAGVSDVENVLIFVSDALRYDFLPERIRQRGVTARAVAPSTFTASALPSLLTGTYPATHRVWMFDDRLPERPPLLSADGRDVGFDASTVWIDLEPREKPPLQIHRMSSEATLSDLEPPFTHVVHDVGPHAPYGFENGVFESTKEFFSDYENDRSRLVELYRRDCKHSAERFLELYERLSERGLLEDTLVVFTSDHGQALGERSNGGRFGHGHPMSPEIVDIPVVFMGAGLPEGERLPTLLSGTDIAPTALSAQGDRGPDLDGVDLWRGRPAGERKPRSDVFQHVEIDRPGISAELTVYAATSAWNDRGGYVFHRKSRLQRCGAIAFDNLLRGYAPAWIHNASLGDAAAMATLGLSGTLSFGTPEFTAEEARAVTPDSLSKRTDGEETIDLSEHQAEQLRNLGYIQ